MVQQWKWLLLWGHFLLGSSRAVCQGLGRRSPGEMQRQLWPPVRPVGSLAGGGGALPAQRTRLSQAAFGATPAQVAAMEHQAVVYQDLLALLSVAFEQQRNIIQAQRSRMDRLLAEFQDLKMELEEDPELQMLYSEVRRQRKAKEKKKKKSKKKGKKEKAQKPRKHVADLRKEADDAQLRHDLADL
ncbi:unnamed protein product [Durusdinium trenchii]|uniref:Uncharacterized protein n=1 Tax=Durusdinium trenchii TaxID=1381693 RepID=A0ABP0HXV1_9DINO